MSFLSPSAHDQDSRTRRTNLTAHPDVSRESDVMSHNLATAGTRYISSYIPKFNKRSTLLRMEEVCGRVITVISWAWGKYHATWNGFSANDRASSGKRRRSSKVTTWQQNDTLKINWSMRDQFSVSVSVAIVHCLATQNAEAIYNEWPLAVHVSNIHQWINGRKIVFWSQKHMNRSILLS